MTAHTCHWPGCTRNVPPRLWGCKEHWFKLPKPLRDRIWATYVPGQETSKRPMPAYLEAAAAVQQWIADQEPKLYRPSNGTEGDSFQSAWCDVCARFDAGGCPILLATMAFNVADREYPKEWHFDQFGQPQCDAYVLEGEPVPHTRCERTEDMFGFSSGEGR